MNGGGRDFSEYERYTDLRYLPYVSNCQWVYSQPRAQKQETISKQVTRFPIHPGPLLPFPVAIGLCAFPILPIARPDECHTSPLRASLLLSARPKWSRTHPETAALVAALLFRLHGLAGFGVVFTHRSYRTRIEQGRPTGGRCGPGFEVGKGGGRGNDAGCGSWLC